MLKKYRWRIYITVNIILLFLSIARIPPFFRDNNLAMYISVGIICGVIIDLWDHYRFKVEEESIGTWLAYLKGLSLYLIILIIFFILLFKLPLYKSLIYGIISVFSAIVFLPRPYDNSWKSAYNWSGLPLAITSIFYVVDYGFIAYFWA